MRMDRTTRRSQCVGTGFAGLSVRVAVFSVLLCCSAALCQILVPDGSRPTFEVSTVKPSNADVNGFKTRTFRGSFSAEHVSVRNLVKFAYRVKSDDEIVGLPHWTESQYFDVNAKVDEQTAATMEALPASEMMRQTRLRVQSLLVERFHLSTSLREERRKVYCLILGKNGSKLKEAGGKASVMLPFPTNGEIAPPPPPAPGAAGNKFSPLDDSQNGKLIGRAANLDMVAQWLSNRPEVGDRTVLNQTGLEGRYDFTLSGLPSVAMGASLEPDEASLFTLIEEQLGLQLRQRSAPIKVLVVEAVARPSAD